MLKMMLYCDLSTMKCTCDDINKELADFSSGHMQVNDSIWFFYYKDVFNGSYLQKDEYIFHEYFEKYLDENSIIFISVLEPRNHMYQLPDDVYSFLEDN